MLKDYLAGIDSPVLISLINAAVMCLLLPAIGRIIDLFVTRVLGRIIVAITRDPKKFLVFYEKVTAPGVVYHELSHAIAVILTGAKLEGVNLYKKEGDTLGMVTFRTRGGPILRALQNTVISSAPVITGIIGIYAAVYAMVLYSLSVPVVILLGYLMVCVFLHMSMSSQDLKLYLKGILVPFFVFFLFSMYVAQHMV